jgi:Mor family transcriptional regulator
MSDPLTEFRHAVLQSIPPHIDRDVLAEVLAEVEIAVRTMYGGDRYYIQSGRALRDAAIRREHRAGERVPYLARKYGMTRQRVHQILTG